MREESFDEEIERVSGDGEDEGCLTDLDDAYVRENYFWDADNDLEEEQES